MNKDEQVKFSWNDIFYLFLFLSHQFLAPDAGKKNKFISFRERSPENHTQFQTKTFKIYTSFQTKTAQKPYPLATQAREKSLGTRLTPWGGTYLILGSTTPGTAPTTVCGHKCIICNMFDAIQELYKFPLHKAVYRSVFSWAEALCITEMYKSRYNGAHA